MQGRTIIRDENIFFWLISYLLIEGDVYCVFRITNAAKMIIKIVKFEILIQNSYIKYR